MAPSLVALRAPDPSFEGKGPQWVDSGPFQNIALGVPDTYGQHQRGVQRSPELVFSQTGIRRMDKCSSPDADAQAGF